MDPSELESADTELLRETLDRKPSPYPRLLMRTSEGRSARIEPSLISAAGLISDYFDFARTFPLDETLRESQLDRRILPLLFAYRHATELALKYAIAQLRRHIRQRVPDFECELPRHHKLGNLVDRANELYDRGKDYLQEMGTVAFLSPQAIGFIRELDRVDPNGEAFRYSHQKPDKTTGRVEPQIATTVDVGVEALRAGMLHVEKELLWFIDMIEITSDLCDEWTADILADAGW